MMSLPLGILSDFLSFTFFPFLIFEDKKLAVVYVLGMQSGRRKKVNLHVNQIIHLQLEIGYLLKWDVVLLNFLFFFLLPKTKANSNSFKK